MFTGIIQGLGRVANISKIEGRRSAKQVTVDLGRLSHRVKVGDSISVNGACLTVVKLYKKKASFDVINETIKKTALSSLTTGEMVNIERSLRIGDRIDGHFILGHVDGVGKIIEKLKQKDQTELWISVDKKLLKHIVPKGPIAVDGVSLTVVDIKSKRFSVALIPHTTAMTTLGIKKKGYKVNIEIDVLGKYVRKALSDRD